MDTKKWFVAFENKVTGPFNEQEAVIVLSKNPSARAWGRGLQTWLGFDAWKKSLGESTIASDQTERLWRIRIGEQELRPTPYDEMIETLKAKTDFSNVLIWTDGYSDWKEIFQIHKIMDDLEISRRTYPRVPIIGTIVCEGASGPFETALLSISEGGLGLSQAPQVKIGEKLKIVIQSQNLLGPLAATVEVLYTGTDGYAGMKFINIPLESKNSIIEYVRKFPSAVN